jgi:superfamily II DNA/RNA helicase
MDTLTRLTRLSQLASSAADVHVEMKLDELTGLEKPHYTVTLKGPSWKAEEVLELLAERPGKPTVIFTESRQLAVITGEGYCKPAGLRTGYIIGDGPLAEGSRITKKTVEQAEADFQAGKLDVVICTVGAGGTGITLTAADTAIMMQRPYQFDLAVQPEDRVHRIGSTGAKIEIVDVVTLDTVDQHRRDSLKAKAGQWGELVKDPRIVRELLGGKK